MVGQVDMFKEEKVEGVEQRRNKRCVVGQADGAGGSLPQGQGTRNFVQYEANSTTALQSTGVAARAS